MFIDFCYECNVDLIITDQGQYVCPNCGQCHGYTLAETPYNSIPSGRQDHPYKKITHFRQQSQNFNLTASQKYTLEKMYRKYIRAYEAIVGYKNNSIHLKFVLHRLGQILKYDTLIAQFNLFKTQSRMKKYNDIWQEICVYNNWEFHTSNAKPRFTKRKYKPSYFGLSSMGY